MFTIHPARLILAPQPERAACPVRVPFARGFFWLPRSGARKAAEGHCRRDVRRGPTRAWRNDLRAAEMRLLQCVRPQPRGRLRRPGRFS